MSILSFSVTDKCGDTVIVSSEEGDDPAIIITTEDAGGGRSHNVALNLDNMRALRAFMSMVIDHYESIEWRKKEKSCF